MFESEVRELFLKIFCFYFVLIFYFKYTQIFSIILFDKIDKIYLDTPSKIAIIDHGQKKTLVLKKEGLPDAGEFDLNGSFSKINELVVK